MNDQVVKIAINYERWDDVSKFIKLCAIGCLSLLSLTGSHPTSMAFNPKLIAVEDERTQEPFQREFRPDIELEEEPSEDIANEEQPTDDVIPQEEAENPFLSLMQAFEHIKQLENYQITYSMTNLGTGEKVAEADLIGNQVTGDLMGVLDFYTPEAHPNHYQFDFISYRYFDLAYIRRFNYLESMAFFEQPYFTADFSDQLTDYMNHYVAIDNEELNRVTLREQQLESLLMLPDMRRLLQINAKHLYELNDLHIVSLERLEIPEYLFSRSENFSFAYELGLTIQPEETDLLLNAPVEINSTQRFEVTENSNSLNFGVKTDSEIAVEMMSEITENSNIPTPNFSRTFNLDSNVMLDKLTKVDIVYSEQTQSYHVRLIGIVENIEFNFFTTDAAGLETTEYMLEYEIKPTTREVPALSEIETLTSREADYILEEIFKNSN